MFVSVVVVLEKQTNQTNACSKPTLLLEFRVVNPWLDDGCLENRPGCLQNRSAALAMGYGSMHLRGSGKRFVNRELIAEPERPIRRMFARRKPMV
jgi:hypothetical protein